MDRSVFRDATTPCELIYIVHIKGFLVTPIIPYKNFRITFQGRNLLGDQFMQIYLFT